MLALPRVEFEPLDFASLNIEFKARLSKVHPLAVSQHRREFVAAWKESSDLKLSSFGRFVADEVDGVSLPFQVWDAAAGIVFPDADWNEVAAQSLQIVPGMLNEIRR